MAEAVAAAAKAGSINNSDCDCKEYPSRTDSYMQASASAGVSGNWKSKGWDQYNKPRTREDQIKYSNFRASIGSSPYWHESPDGGEIVEHPADADHKCLHFHAKKDLRSSGKVFPYDPQKG